MTLTLRSLIEQYQLSEEDCNSVISTEHLEKISDGHCLRWRLLPPFLGVEGSTIDIIERDFVEEKEKRHAFFFQWRQMKESEATYKTLISALLGNRSTEDAHSLCKMLQNRPSISLQYPVRPRFSRIAARQALGM